MWSTHPAEHPWWLLVISGWIASPRWAPASRLSAPVAMNQNLDKQLPKLAQITSLCKNPQVMPTVMGAWIRLRGQLFRRQTPYRPASVHQYQPYIIRNMASSAAIHAERFLADRAAPLCGFDIGKSFALLRFARDVHKVFNWLTTDQMNSLHSEKEKKYAHYLGLASWAGARIIQGKSLFVLISILINLIIFLGQWTAQAKDLYDLLILTFSDASGRRLADLDFLQKNSGLSATEWEDLLQYTVQVCHQMVNVLIADIDTLFSP